MLTENEIYALLEQGLEQTQRGAAVRHPFSTTLPILGKDGVFDSLDTMLFLDCVDDLLTARIGKPVTLVNDDALSREESPLPHHADSGGLYYGTYGRSMKHWLAVF